MFGDLGRDDQAMTTYDITQVVRGTFNWSLANGGLGQNVFHFGTADVPDQDAMDLLAVEAENFTSIGGSFVKIRDMQSNEVTLVGADFRTVDPSNPLESHGTYDVAGSVSGESVALETAVVTTLYSELASRRGRGRFFLPGLATGKMTGGRIDPTTASVISGRCGDWRDSLLSDAGFDWIVWSRVASTGRSISSFETRVILHHQRRRNS